MSDLLHYLVPVAAAGLGTLGFSMLFHIGGRRLILSALGGMLTWTCYLLTAHIIAQDLASYALASVFAALYAQGLARMCKAPATLFRLSAIIPLIPGGALYTTMQQAAIGKWQHFGQQGIHTLLLAASIALGLVIGELIGRFIKSCFGRLNKKG